MFDEGRLAVIQRTGYENQSRSHFTGFDIWGTANPGNSQGTGWLGRYLDSLPQPVDPLVAWNTQRETPRPLMGRLVGVPAITSPAAYSFASPNSAHRSGLRARCADAHLVAPARRSPAPRVRERHHAGGARHARSCRHGGHLPSCRHLSEQRVRAGAAGRGRRHEQGHRHQGVLGADRRLRHARRAGREPGLLLQPDGHAQRRPEDRSTTTCRRRGC